MAKRKRMQHCLNCGVELGVFDLAPGEFESCGAPECARELRDTYRQRQDEARQAAEDDGYSRYG